MLLSVSVRDGGREGSDGVYASGWTGLGSWDCGIMGIPRFAPGNIYGREGCLGRFSFHGGCFVSNAKKKWYESKTVLIQVNRKRGAKIHLTRYYRA